MHRLLADTEALLSPTPRLSDAALRHLRVLRPREGEQIELFDGRGAARVFAYMGGALQARSDLRHHAPTPPERAISLFACVTKGSRWDWTIEKATELGVSRIVPVISARTIVRIPPEERQEKRARWTRVAEDAARQSDAMWIPAIEAPMDFASAARLAMECDTLVGALKSPPPPDVLTALRRIRGGGGARPLAIFIGPEGDFSPEELAALMAFAHPVSLGALVLRAETAAIYGVGAIRAFLEAER